MNHAGVLKWAKPIYRAFVSEKWRQRLFSLRLKFRLALKLVKMNEESLCLAVKPTLHGDGFSTLHNVEYLENQEFAHAFEKSISGLAPTHRQNASIIRYRAHIIGWAVNQVSNIDGDFASFGVNFGILEKTIAELVSVSSESAKHMKDIYLFDTWGEYSGGHPGYSADIFSEVSSRFDMYPFVHLIRGLIPDSFSQISIQKLSFLLIDLNGWEAELKVLERYYSAVAPGGIIYFDDYGWDYPKLREVVDQFLIDKPESLLHFASGNAIIVKK